MPLHVIVGSIYIYTRCAQRGIKRQSLVKLLQHMHAHIFGQTTIVCIEVLIVPLKSGWLQHIVRQAIAIRNDLTCSRGSTFFITPVIISEDLKSIHLSDPYMRCQIKTKSHDAILVQTNVLPIQPYLRGLTCTLKLYKNFLILPLFRCHKCLHISHSIVRKILDRHTECILLIPRPGQSHHGLLHATLRKLPIAIKIQHLPLRSKR